MHGIDVFIESDDIFSVLEMWLVFGESWLAGWRWTVNFQKNKCLLLDLDLAVGDRVYKYRTRHLIRDKNSTQWAVCTTLWVGDYLGSRIPGQVAAPIRSDASLVQSLCAPSIGRGLNGIYCILRTRDLKIEIDSILLNDSRMSTETSKVF